MAEAVRQGAASVDGAEVHLLSIEGGDIVEGRWRNDDIMETLDGSDAIIFGCPTYMGCVSAQMKAFMDATSERFFTRAWTDKLASAFSVSGGPSGDKLNTMQTLATFAMQHGMIWVGMNHTPFNEEGINRLSFYFGAAGQALQEPPGEKPDELDKKTGWHLGARVATLATNGLTRG
jgi:NAD(P)H dehydrogenase (quinone)